MARVLIIGVIVAVAFTLFGLVDAAMADASRARGLSKPVWIVIIVMLPLIGAILWFTIGRGKPQPPVPDEPNMSQRDVDNRVADLEKRLRELDDEVFPGEDGNQ
ncbi:MAG: PLD nuclease N-terminal domain-containing protein [Canibacter sp.]